MDELSFKINRGRACCFSGHRKMTRAELEGASLPLINAIERCYDEGFTDFIAGGAVGFDMLAGVAVANLKPRHPGMRLILALPCRGHTSKWGELDRHMLDLLIGRADEVIYVSEHYTTRCMLKRNDFMVENSRRLICYLRERRGGTYYTYRIASAAGHKIDNICKEK